MNFGVLPTTPAGISRIGLWFEDFGIPDKSAEWVFAYDDTYISIGFYSSFDVDTDRKGNGAFFFRTYGGGGEE